MDVGRLGGGAVRQAGPHLGVQGLAQVGGGSPHAAAPAMDGAAVAGRAQEVPEQRQHFLLHHLGLARVELGHQVWREMEGEREEGGDVVRWRVRVKTTSGGASQQPTCHLLNEIHLGFAI